MRRSKEEHGTSQSNDAEHNKAGVWSFLQNCRGLWRLLFWLRSCFLNFSRSRSGSRRGSRGTGGGSSGRNTAADCLFLFAFQILGLNVRNTSAGNPVHADDPRTSAYGVLGRFLDQQGASFDDVEKIVLTGLGSTYFHENIFGIPTIHALELDAIGRGGLYLSGLDEALVVSLGTGSAFIRASKTNGFCHLGGSGVGGGTLAGMAERFLGVTDIFALSEMALRGNKAMADLRIADVQEEDVPGLAADLTAANFGRIKSGASDADLAAALFNMIYENVGVMASLALSQDTTRNVVLTGSLASLAPAAKTFDIFNQMHDVFGIDYIIPPHPSFATAVGALLCYPLPEN